MCDDPRCDRARNGERHEIHDVSKEDAERTNSLSRLIDTAADLTGAGAGPVIGFLMAGPVGSIVGGVAGAGIVNAIKYLGHEMKERHLAPMQEIRIGAAITFAIRKYEQRIKNGDSLRYDNFFQDSKYNRSSAKENLEGMLLAAQNEYEQRKLRFYGNLAANIWFEDLIDLSMANHYLRLAQRLSYSQLCLMSVFHNRSEYKLRDMDYRKPGTFPKDEGVRLLTVLQEIYDLYSQDLIAIEGLGVMSTVDIVPSRMVITPVGENLYQLMELGELEKDDVQRQASLLIVR